MVVLKEPSLVVMIYEMMVFDTYIILPKSARSELFCVSHLLYFKALFRSFLFCNITGFLTENQIVY